MKKVKLVLMALPITLLLMSSCKKKIYGCMDKTALNYSEVATLDAGNCVYQAEEEVVISNVYHINDGDWSVVGGTSYNVSLNWAQITQDVIDNGAVSAYFGDASVGDWSPLPYTESAGYNDVSNTTFITYSLGDIEVYNEDSDGYLPLSSPGAVDIKIVILK